MQKYDRTTQQLYQGRQRHNKRIYAEDAMYDEHYDRRRTQAYEFTHSPENFNHGANTPPDYPSAYLTYGPEVENIGPDIYREPSPEVAENRRSMWLARQENLFPPQSYRDPQSAITSPEGSYLRNSSSNEQRADSSRCEIPLSRQPSHAVRRGKPLAQFDGIEETPWPSSSREASGSRKQRRTHNSTSHRHSRIIGSSHHSHHSTYLPQPQQAIVAPRRETGGSSHHTRSRQASRHEEDGCCVIL